MTWEFIAAAFCLVVFSGIVGRLFPNRLFVRPARGLPPGGWRWRDRQRRCARSILRPPRRQPARLCPRGGPWRAKSGRQPASRPATRRSSTRFHRAARPQSAARVEDSLRRQSRQPLDKYLSPPLAAGLSTSLHRVIARPLGSASDNSRIGAVWACSSPKRGLKCLPTRRARP